MRFTMERQPLLRIGAKPLETMVGVGRIELPTPAMSKHFPCRHTADFRWHSVSAPRIWPHLFRFVSAPRFIANLEPLLQPVSPESHHIRASA